MSVVQSRDPLFVHISQLQIDDDRVFASAWNRKYVDEAINELMYELGDLQLQLEVLSQEIQYSEEEFQTGLIVQRDDPSDISRAAYETRTRDGTSDIIDSRI